eukprot:1266865-Pyramimonas_sp.AAC.1
MPKGTHTPSLDFERGQLVLSAQREWLRLVSGAKGCTDLISALFSSSCPANRGQDQRGTSGILRVSALVFR